MGEKLLARRLIGLLRETHGRTSRSAMALLEWARDQREWLWPEIEWEDTAPSAAEAGGQPALPEGDACPEDPLCWERLGELAAAVGEDEADPALFGCVDAASELLAFDAVEREVLRVVCALERCPPLAALRSRLVGAGEDMVGFVGRAAGAGAGEAARLVRCSGPVKLGLLYLSSDTGSGAVELGLDWRFSRVIDDGLVDAERLIDALTGVRQPAVLGPEDFEEQGEVLRLLVRMLSGALRRRAAGVNVLIYGPPGTGKTEFARTLAAEVGATLYATGEADADGEEPSRLDRLTALKRAQRLLEGRGDSLLLFDEMEDLLETAGSPGGGSRRRGSKIFVNRLLEENRVPTLWTSNDIDAVDPAHLRRMSYVLRMGYPTQKARARIVARLAEAEGVGDAFSGLERLLPGEEGTTAVARIALRAAALAGGGACEAEAVGRSLLLGLRGGRDLPPSPAPAIDLDLYEAAVSISDLVSQIAAPGAPSDVSLLLTGPPGTGKTALAAHVADRLGRSLTVKRASDLLSSWVGGTEANIAAAFAEAREQGSVLLFDEVDSLLLDRADAQRSWEVSQVNELLTWMDTHRQPFIAATNFANRLDPAALRRFVFKIDLGALSPERAALAYVRFFGGAAPPGLAQVPGLTPGDFAVVARQLRFRPSAGAEEILALLEAEVRAKPERPVRIGF